MTHTGVSTDYLIGSQSLVTLCSLSSAPPCFCIVFVTLMRSDSLKEKFSMIFKKNKSYFRNSLQNSVRLDSLFFSSHAETTR